MTVIMILCIWHKQHKSSKKRNVQPSLFGTFSEESLQNAVATTVIIRSCQKVRPNIKHQTQLVTTANTKASYYISQLLIFNSVKHTRALHSTSTVCHSSEHCSGYVALKLHAVTCIVRTPGIFHAFTECDTISSFSGRGKSLEILASFPDITETLEHLLLMEVTCISDSVMSVLERFV